MFWVWEGRSLRTGQQRPQPCPEIARGLRAGRATQGPREKHPEKAHFLPHHAKMQNPRAKSTEGLSPKGVGGSGQSEVSTLAEDGPCAAEKAMGYRLPQGRERSAVWTGGAKTQGWWTQEAPRMPCLQSERGGDPGVGSHCEGALGGCPGVIPQTHTLPAGTASPRDPRLQLKPYSATAQAGLVTSSQK